MSTKIEWAEKVWNLWHGCTKIAMGCKNCYAEKWYWRHHGKGSNFNEIKMFPERLNDPLHWKKPSRIFVNSMSDLFHEKVEFDFINEIFNTIVGCRIKKLQHKFLILTKRPERAEKFVERYFRYGGLPNIFPNIQLGVSISTQEDADRLIPILLQIPAKVRFVSVEPMLEEIDLKEWLFEEIQVSNSQYDPAIKSYSYPEYELKSSNKIHWVIIGAESGHNKRYCDIEWIRDLKNQCQDAGVPVFIKQIHDKINQSDTKFMLNKDILTFPKDLQIQQYPKEE